MVSSVPAQPKLAKLDSKECLLFTHVEREARLDAPGIQLTTETQRRAWFAGATICLCGLAHH
jgi:hypothetical protein